MKLISSANNKLIKEVKKLSKNSSYRKKTNRFIVEGLREVKLCFDSDYKIDHLLCSNNKLFDDFSNVDKNFVQKEIMNMITYRESSEILAIVTKKENSLENYTRDKNNFVLVLEKPEKPGNIGAILRTPQEDDHRGNIHVGGHVSATTLTAKEMELCQAVGARLKQDDIFFAGLDLIGEQLTEVNLTSPTGVREIKELYGIDASDLLIQAMEQRILQSSKTP